jgi:uncharacterized membrane protein
MGLSGFSSSGANAVNGAGQAAGGRYANGVDYAVEWSGGSVLKLATLPGLVSCVAFGINQSGQVVGYSYNGAQIENPTVSYAIEWSKGSVINLQGLPSFTSRRSIL